MIEKTHIMNSNSISQPAFKGQNSARCYPIMPCVCTSDSVNFTRKKKSGFLLKLAVGIAIAAISIRKASQLIDLSFAKKIQKLEVDRLNEGFNRYMNNLFARHNLYNISQPNLRIRIKNLFSAENNPLIRVITNGPIRIRF